MPFVASRPQWHHRASCCDVGPDVFFTDTTEAEAAALEYCQGCPVRAQCAAAGAGEQFGVWGGLTVQERRTRRRAA